MIAGRNGRQAGVATVLGVAVAVVALLIVATLPSSGPTHLRVLSLTAAARDPSCAVGSEPTWPAYNPVNHDIYVPNFNSGNISVISGSCKLVATIKLPAGAEPEQAVFDPRFNYIDVTDYFLSQVYEISGTTIVTTFGGFVNPVGIAYDPACFLAVGVAGCVVVANLGGDTVRTLSGVSYTVGPDPDQIAYDPFWDTLLVTTPSTDTVSVLNAATFSLVANVTVGSAPEGVAFDPSDSEDYVANAGSNNVTVLGGLAGPGGIDGTISGFDVPTGVAWDQSTLHIYVANHGSGKVFLLSGLSIVKKESTASTSGATGLAYDDATDKIYAAGNANDLVYELS